VGGGGGALAFECAVEVSWFGMLSPSSSIFGGSLTDVGRSALESDANWLRRLVNGGAGGVFRIDNEDGDGGSGVLPADSLSKTDSRSDS
jgi:hypothetical protein